MSCTQKPSHVKPLNDESGECAMRLCAYNFDLRAVSELLDGVTVLCVVLQKDGHLEGGGLQRVPERNTQQHCSNH